MNREGFTSIIFNQPELLLAAHSKLINHFKKEIKMKTNNFQIHTALLTTTLLIIMTSTITNAKLQISVNGDRNTTYFELSPGDEVFLGVWNEDAIIDGKNESYMALVVNPTAVIDYTSGVSLCPDPAVYLDHSASLVDQGLPLTGEDGIGGAVFLLDQYSIPSGSTIFDQIMLHYVGPGDSMVHLYTFRSGDDLELNDTVIIHQVPEPMTIGLLGLGGLFLRRRN